MRILRRSTSPLDAVQDLNVEHAIGDVTDLDSLLAAMQGVEVVFNVAAISSYWRNTAELIYKVNVDGARNVFEAAARSGVRRVVHTSSAAAVGIISGRSATEADPFNQPARQFPYGHSKWLTEAIVRERVKAGQDIVMVNPTIMFRGREQSRPEAGRRLLQRLADDVGELGIIEHAPVQEGRNMSLTLGPTRKKSEARDEARREREAKLAIEEAERSKRKPTKVTPVKVNAATKVAAKAAPKAAAKAATEEAPHADHEDGDQENMKEE